MHENRGTKEENIEKVKKSEANREWLHRLSERQRRKRLSAAIGRQRLVAQAEIDRLSSLLTIPEKNAGE
ncbi:MAG TPA: hypothetical protein C5S37_11745 [Methanophagales archaeon]|nr:hypothetical protein [Methanophagales archaeon]